MRVNIGNTTFEINGTKVMVQDLMMLAVEQSEGSRKRLENMLAAEAMLQNLIRSRADGWLEINEQQFGYLTACADLVTYPPIYIYVVRHFIDAMKKIKDAFDAANERKEEKKPEENTTSGE